MGDDHLPQHDHGDFWTRGDAAFLVALALETEVPAAAYAAATFRESDDRPLNSRDEPQPRPSPPFRNL
jgi:hypothetical protein